jgi:N-acetylmuramic acid 6-phosphate etherase
MIDRKSRWRGLVTEAVHPRARDLERRPTREVVSLLISDELKAQRAAYACVDQITRAAELIVQALKGGGRLVYVGAGTSGRLGALDAAELPPTFGSDPKQVIAILAGGPRAMLRSSEGAEDRATAAERRLSRLGVGPGDVVCAIAASGATAFARSALTWARAHGAHTIFVTCVRDPDHGRAADVVIAAEVGPEVLAGSTRLKAGTATKMILNALSTASMVRLGKVYRGRMIDVLASNEKLKDRARRIVGELAGVDEKTARALLRRAGGRPKIALALHALGLPLPEVERQLALAGGDLHRLLHGERRAIDRAKRPGRRTAGRAPRGRPAR